jgi:hypothetical protein
MAISLIDTSSQYVGLNFTSTLNFAAPVTVALWMRGTSDAPCVLFSKGDANSVDDNWFFFAGGSLTGTLTDELILLSANTAAGGDILGYTSATRSELWDGAWHHIAITSTGSAWSIYLDGSSKTVTVGQGANDGTNWDNANHDTADIGRRVFNSGTFYNSNHEQAHTTVWNVALSAAEIASLAKGVSAKATRPSAIVEHWELMRGDATSPGEFNSHDGTMGNTPGSTDHPPIYQPTGGDSRRRTNLLAGLAPQQKVAMLRGANL